MAKEITICIDDESFKKLELLAALMEAHHGISWTPAQAASSIVMSDAMDTYTETYEALTERSASTTYTLADKGRAEVAEDCSPVYVPLAIASAVNDDFETAHEPAPPEPAPALVLGTPADFYWFEHDSDYTIGIESLTEEGVKAGLAWCREYSEGGSHVIYPPTGDSKLWRGVHYHPAPPANPQDLQSPDLERYCLAVMKRVAPALYRAHRMAVKARLYHPLTQQTQKGLSPC